MRAMFAVCFIIMIAIIGFVSLIEVNPKPNTGTSQPVDPGIASMGK